MEISTFTPKKKKEEERKGKGYLDFQLDMGLLSAIYTSWYMYCQF